MDTLGDPVAVSVDSLLIDSYTHLSTSIADEADGLYITRHFRKLQPE